MIEILALGEILIDFTPFMNNDKKQCFEQNPGGAPLNVLTMLSRFGIKSGFIGSVGKDSFGDKLIRFIKSVNIDTNYLKQVANANTTVAFVHLFENGNRDFSFYRNPGADQMITQEDIEAVNFKGVKVFHFGSLSLTHEPSRGSTKLAIKKAQQFNCLISFDPNYRPALWNSKREARAEILSVMADVDVLKVSEEELLYLTEDEDIEKSCLLLANKYNIQLIAITLGEKGSAIFFRDTLQYIKGAQVKAVDTTGAGDSYWGSMLYQLIRHGKMNTLNNEILLEFATFSNQVAAYVTTKLGSASIMPGTNEVAIIKKLK